MNQKEALLMMKLGCKIRRPGWTYALYAELLKGYVCIFYKDAPYNRDSIEYFLTQEHNDWEVYCPQDNE